MMFHIYVFGIKVILSHGIRIIWMALWRKLCWFVGPSTQASAFVFGLWRWNFGSKGDHSRASNWVQLVNSNYGKLKGSNIAPSWRCNDNFLLEWCSYYRWPNMITIFSKNLVHELVSWFVEIICPQPLNIYPYHAIMGYLPWISMWGQI